jgi:8-oxo-dGTP pyrophosphatase MutT (NUDIX family)
MLNNTFLKKLIYQVSHQLPGEDSHLEMSPLYRMKSSVALAINSNYKESAVAVILYLERDTIYGIVTQRNEYNGQHSGQISFPGGKKDENDLDLRATALRESFEEIGVNTAYLEFVGELTPVYIPVSNFKMSPFLFYCQSRPQTSPDPREVAEIIHFEIQQLLNENNVGTTEIKLPDGTIRKEIPCFHLENKVIWGATAIVLNELKVILNNLK